MQRGQHPLPAVVAGADWSAHPGGRALAVARRSQGEHYVLIHLGEVPEGLGLFAELLRAAEDGPAVFGSDFPIGVPAAWARRAGVADFPALLRELDETSFSTFTAPAGSARDIGLMRPFYPAHPAGARRRHLAEALGVASFAALLRRCDVASHGCAPFWLVGPNQVGRAAIHAWRSLLRPALRAGWPLRLWPFDGAMLTAAAGELVVAETYPSRYRRAWRGADGSMLLRRLGLGVPRRLADTVLGALAPERPRSHIGDALCALLGLLAMVRGLIPCRPPRDPDIRRFEGWVVGLPAGRAGRQEPARSAQIDKNRDVFACLEQILTP